MRLVLIILLMLSLGGASIAQSKKKKRIEQEQSSSPTSLDPSYAKEQYAPKKAKSKKVSKGPTYESEQEYYERIAKLEKVKRKNEKLSLKPQYSDPMYFGHKRPPKKHKAGKLKFCKECGLRH